MARSLGDSGASCVTYVWNDPCILVEKMMLKSFLFAVMVHVISNGEMSFADFHIAIKWLCDISQHDDCWLLNYATCAVCQSFSFYTTLTSKSVMMNLFRMVCFSLALIFHYYWTFLVFSSTTVNPLKGNLCIFLVWSGSPDIFL